MHEIKKIWITPCPLVKKKSLASQPGLLLKILFTDQSVGYSSLHPLSNFREGSLSDYLPLIKDLSFLKKKKLSVKENLLQLCFEGAFLDATYRKNKTSLLSGYPPIKNHKLILNLFDQQSLDEFNNNVFKIKMGKDIQKETRHLRQVLKNTQKPIKLRLDFNSCLSQNEWKKWEIQNQDLEPLIDFIEDPCSPLLNGKLPVASDWEFSFFSPIKIVKPSRYHLKNLYQNIAQGNFKRIIFTHTLTHPLEARWSHFLANKFYQTHPHKKEVCGLDYPLDLYEPNEFTSFLNKESFYSPQGFGIGFESVLEKQKWTNALNH